MKIEVLYKEICNLYGDYENINYLKKTKDVEVIETSLNEKPRFTYEDIDLVYIGSCSFYKEELLIEKLLPYKEVIIDKIDKGDMFLVTGTAVEIFGKKIIDNDKEITSLGIFDYTSYRFSNRHNSFFLGEFENIKIVGNKSQFFFLKGVDEDLGFIKVIKGYGNDLDSSFEGIRKNNFYMTSLLGPFLILNPLFTKYLIGKKYKDTTLKYEDVALEAYNIRLNDLESENARILMEDHG